MPVELLNMNYTYQLTIYKGYLSQLKSTKSVDSNYSTIFFMAMNFKIAYPYSILTYITAVYMLLLPGLIKF